MRYAKLSSVCLVLMMVLSPMAVLVGTVAAKPVQANPLFPGGDGSPGNPYWIVNVSDLQNMNTLLSSHYQLQNDIDASDTINWNGGLGFETVGSNAAQFHGSLDGQGYVIRDLYINRPGVNQIALFGYMSAGTSITDVGMENVDITGEDNVAALVGETYGTITNCYATGSVTGDQYVGGLVGLRGGSNSISGSYFNGDVSGSDTVGGLVGRCTSTVDQCFSMGYAASMFRTGGLVGSNEASGTITNSYSTAAVNGGGGNSFGGLVGGNYATVSHCYSSGPVSGGYRVGGLVGNLDVFGTITDCYATGIVSGTWFDVGGLVGYCYGTVTRCYSTNNVTGTSDVGGFVGSDSGGTYNDNHWDTDTSGRTNGHGAGPDPGGVTGQNTGSMLLQSTFDPPWDFTNDWWILDGETRPFLRMEYSTTIRNSHQLQLVEMDRNADYVLANDLTMDITDPAQMWGTSPAAGSGFFPIGTNTNRFTGSFTGNEHVISDLYIYRPAMDDVGLIGAVDSGVTVSFVGLVDANVTGQNRVGSLIGRTNGITLSCFATGEVESMGVNVGGLVGQNWGIVQESHADAYAHTTSMYAGALVGYNNNNIIQCWSKGTVESNNYAGGLAGLTMTLIQDSYSTASVTTNTDNAGGLAGYCWGSPMQLVNCWSSGPVDCIGAGVGVGGLLGNFMAGATFSQCFWDIETSGQATTIGQAAGAIEGKTTAQMMSYSTFLGAGWSLGNTTGSATWFMRDGETRPFLQCEFEITVRNSHNLQLMWLDMNSDFVLGNDVEMDVLDAAQMWGTNATQGKGFLPVGNNSVKFTGSLDGNGFSISDLFINRAAANIGLFGWADSVGGFNDIDLSKVNVTGLSNTGALIGYGENGPLSRCSVSGIVDGGDNCGGLTGYIGDNVDNSTSSADVTGGNNVGGLTGNTGNNVIASSSGYGNVSGFNRIGALIGRTTSSDIHDCTAHGNTTGTGDEIGGLIGRSSADVYDCTSHGKTYTTAPGPSQVGGLIGRNEGGSVDNCHSYGETNATASQVGGLIGRSVNGVAVTNCTSNGFTTNTDAGAMYTGGLMGWNDGPVTNCTSYGDTNGDEDYVGGLIGYNIGTVMDSHSHGYVTGGNDYVGGLLGSSGATVQDCNTYGNTSGVRYNIGGLIGEALGATQATNCHVYGDTDGNGNVGGLVGWVSAGADFDHCTAHCNVTGSATLGGFSGINNGGLIENCTSYANVTGGSNSGGFTGEITSGGVCRNCIAYGNVSGGSWVGGFSGNNLGGAEQYNCTAYGNVDAGGTYAGGLMGWTTGSIRDCMAYGKVNSSSNWVGGLIGWVQSGTVGGCHAYGEVIGVQNVGGLLGYVNSGEANNSTASGNVSGSSANVGGLIGYMNAGTLTNCTAYCNTTQTANADNVGGLIGYGSGTVRECTSYGTVTGFNALGASFVGGLIGQAIGTVENCHSYATVYGFQQSGGLIGFNHATVRNCTAHGLVDAWNSYAGGFLGQNDPGGWVENCTAYGDVESDNDYTGGFTGSHEGAAIIGCTAYGDVTADAYVGGFVGRNVNGNRYITNCSARGNTSGNYEVGGFAGLNQASIFNSTVHCNVTGGDRTGGFAGCNQLGTVMDCYSHANVDGDDIVGGLIGYMQSGTVNTSYSMGLVVGNTNTGGLVGSHAAGEVNDCFWDNETSGLTTSVNGTGKTTIEMMSQATFDPPWDFASIWGIHEANTYPFLLAFGVPPAPAVDVSVTMDVSPAIATPGGNFNMWLNVTNNGLDNAANVNATVFDLTIGIADIDHDMGAAASVWGTNGTWDVGVLLGGQTATATLLLAVNNGTGGQTFNYVANVTTTTAETSWANNQDTAQVFINSPPTAVNDAYVTDEDTNLVVNATAGVLANDTDPDMDPLTVIGNQSPTALGINVTVNANGSFTYNVSGLAIFEELAAGEYLIDTFDYTITDGVADSIATVTINITGVNDDPIAQNDTATINEDSGATAIDVLANDDDADNGTVLSIASVTQPADGTVVITGNGTGLTYQPDANFSGTSVFAYTIDDGDGGTDTATVNVTVIGVNDPPLAVDDTATVDEDTAANAIDILANDVEVEGQPLTVTAVTQPANGAAVITGSGTGLTYEPDADFFGTDVFTYTISDGTLTDTATVTVTVRNVNDPPVITPVSAPPGVQGQFYQLTLTAADIDADALTWSGVSNSFWVFVYADGVLNGTPSNAGTYWALVTVNDGQGGTDDINLTITIEPDLDGDGIIDASDDDRDGDGVANDEDLWPDNPAESADADGDGVGDNADPDDDNDGIPDTEDENPYTPDEPGAGGFPAYLWIAILLVAIGIGVALGYMFMGRSAAKGPKPEHVGEDDLEPEDDVEPADEFVEEPVTSGTEVEGPTETDTGEAGPDPAPETDQELDDLELS